MKKLLKGLGILLCAVLVVGIAAVCMTAGYFDGAELSTLTLEQLEAYINDRVIPIVLLVLTAVGTILMALLPLIGKIKRSSESFRSAEEGIKITSAEAKRSQDEAKLLFEKMQEQIEDMRRICNETDKKIEDISAKEEQIREIMKIGFCNTPSLVRNGYAKRIYDISATEEKNEKA